MSKYKVLVPILFSFMMTAGYGLCVRLAYGSEQFSDIFGTVSVGFLFFVPLAIGVCTQFFAPRRFRTHWGYAFFAPWIPCLIFSIAAVLLTWEVWICIVMVIPLFFFMATAGGLLTCWFLAAFEASTQSKTTLALVFMLLPFFVSPIEAQFPQQDALRSVHTQIEVEADAETVWGQITRVAPISEAEHRFSFFHLAGLPRPQQATLTFDGVGGVRRGQWENNLAFIERISRWQPPQSYSMHMEADTTAVSGTNVPLREIGGRYFDVVEGTYTIEPVSDNKVILHFTSSYRLSTRFNFYSHMWTDFFMRDVQKYILHI
ncbi:MAG: hypothetical protein KDJ52_32175, partial [Anaerolineae bacterium]|nr:hypothetical protein [Anaerolineae bacterium]